MSTANQRSGRPVPRHAASRRRRAGVSLSAPSVPRRPHRPRGSTSAHGQAGVVRHASRRRRRRHAVLVSVLGVAMFLTSGVAWAYRDLNSNIDAHDVDDLLGDDRPQAAEDPLDGAADPAEGQPINLVLIGSDDRSGDNEDIGGGGHDGIRSDTVIVAHISADRDRAELISIPRDSWVTIPECELPDGSTSHPQEGKFNGAFQIGGSTGD
ncbi:MAG TPA: LCP family protein, partial [Beutenbergiaceae bacterium]|nr:LCP family protein [Beutenbergiaceae bacterium]